MRLTRPVWALLSVALLPFAVIGVARADTIDVQVAAEEDDAEENLASGDMESLTSSDLELGSEFDSDPDTEGIQLVGIRFPGVNIPPGSIINSAAIQFTVDENDKNPATANFGINGELSLDPAQFTSANSNISDRPSTSATVSWMNVPSWTGQVGTAGPDQLTPDISAIVQEIIDQPGWAAGNAMAFGIAPIDAAGNIDPTSLANRTAESYDSGHTSGPSMQVDFVVPEPSSALLLVLGLTGILGFRRRR